MVGGLPVRQGEGIRMLEETQGRTQSGDIFSRIKYTKNAYGKVFIEESGTARCLIPIIEDKKVPSLSPGGTFSNETRREFYRLYRPYVPAQVFATGNPPAGPVSFDNCLQANTERIMMELASNIFLGAAVEKAGIYAIRGAARWLSNRTLTRAYKIMIKGGRGSLSASNKMAKFGGSIAEYGEFTVKMFELNQTRKDIEGWYEVLSQL